jgi:serine/threonine-protein kinase
MSKLEQFLEFAAKSGLVSQRQLADVVNAVRDELPQTTPDDLRLARIMDVLVEREWLTRWQCAKLLEGKFKGFFLGKYKLMAHVGTGRATSRYLAENQRGDAVEIVVGPSRGNGTLFLAIKPDSFIEEDFQEGRRGHSKILLAHDLRPIANSPQRLANTLKQFIDNFSPVVFASGDRGRMPIPTSSRKGDSHVAHPPQTRFSGGPHRRL